MGARMTVVAETGERFAGFAPYVACIDDQGVVGFQARLRAGGAGVFLGDGTTVEAVFEGPVTSHPDRDESGAMCAFVEDALVRIERGQAVQIRDPRPGPLGPTMRDGRIAFRATREGGRSGIYVWGADGVVTVTETGRYARFHGLPLLDGRGRAVFRADRTDGVQVIAVDDHELITTGDRFRELGAFASVNRAGTVAFTAIATDGTAGVFTIAADDETGAPSASATTHHGFVSFRGALISDTDVPIFYATPPDGQLAIYRHHQRLLGIGDPIDGGPVITDLALNPVSINTTAQLAVRLQLSDGREQIVRID